MLKLVDIKKVYSPKDNPVEALKGISIRFRKNEFVSILGPSGCGKTTALNIIGGLDHYTSGDLVINGISTKDFNDRDWDVYRNHKIGFIFQSYNLIPHQNIEENVELALTISGIGKEERKKRARAALDQVGLKGMYTKHANQLSGGQCQRVAIARALVNEPDILLADEPTGALDSETSVQIMELIKKISEKKLVIMVTHNPELAEKYSTRIVRLLDGQIVEDTNPFSMEDEAKENEDKIPQSKEELEKAKAKMSWWTATKLSARNLLSKAKRTALIVVASSIGIVGVSAVLAVSQGVTGYIQGMQDDMLSGNPVCVAEKSLDISSLVSTMTNMQKTKVVSSAYKDGKIDIQFMIKTMIATAETMGSTQVENNMTEDFETYVDDMPKEYYSAIGKGYGIDVKNNLYTNTQIDGHDESERFSITSITSACQTIIEHAKDGKYASYGAMIDSYTDAIGQCLDNKEYVLDQYDVVSGKYAEKEDEVMIVLNHSNRITEFILTLLGYYGQKDFLNALYYYSGETDSEFFDEEAFKQHQSISIDSLLGKTYDYYPNNTIYDSNLQEDGGNYDPNADSAAAILDPDKLKPFFYNYTEDQLVEEDNTPIQPALKMKVVGVLKPKETTTYGCMDSGLYFTPAFAKRYLQDNLESKISKFLSDYLSSKEGATSFPSSVVKFGNKEITSGIGYTYELGYQGETLQGVGLIGAQDVSSSLMAMMAGSSGSSGGSGSISSSTGITIKKLSMLSLRAVGGNDIAGQIDIYPHSFKTKYLVTDYLSKWNEEGDITLSSGKVLSLADRHETKYTDNLEVIIGLINGVINIVTIALIIFTALSLVVSTVMIGIITYVSVMERIKEIGVIRSLGGRKNDVSHLFNAETFMIGFASGIFGLVVTYILEIILDLTLGVKFELGMILDLQWWTALIILGVSILLTVIAGLVPSRAAARQDPVVALRTE